MNSFLNRAVAFALILLLNTQNVSADQTSDSAADAIRVLLPATAFSMTWLSDDQDGMIQFIKSFSSTVATTLVLKQAVDKQRPNGEELSFPSGHTSVSFSGASFIQRRYGWRYGLPAYVAASYVGWSRVDSDAHYWEDVIAGASIAIGFNHLFVEPSADGFNVQLYPMEDSVGIQISRSW